MAVSEDVVLNLVGKVYDAALDEQKWPFFLEAFAQAVGGSSALLRSSDLHSKSASFVASVCYDSGWKEAYCNHFVKQDYFNPIISQFTPGAIFTSDQHCDLTELRKSEFYNDYLVPQDKVHVFGVLLHKEGNHSVVLGVQRGKRAGAFGEEQAQLMNVIAPHVIRAMQVHRRITSITVEKDWALSALDQLRMGVILTNRSGKPLFVNRAADQMLTKSQGISVYHDKLLLNSTQENAQLYRLVTDAAQGTPGANSGGDMRISMSSRFDFLHCLVMPVSMELSARLGVALASGCVAIFLSKPGSLQLPPKRLAILYGLSPAESRLAAKLAEFNSLEQAAYDLGIALGTARSQLAAVFAKTGAKGQAELLMLLATGTLAHCRDE